VAAERGRRQYSANSHAKQDRWWEEIHTHCVTLTEEERTSLQWDSRNDDTWQMFFQQRQELELAQHDGGVIPPPQKN
jgi:hypothetical protein